MSSFRKPLLVMVCMVLLIGTGAVMAQESELYNDFPTQLQTRNIPAGTVRDPGSQALYIIDTGVNLREEAGADLTGFNAPLSVVDQGDGRVNPFGVGGDLSVYNDDETLDISKVNQNFITITNTHPTQAVTVHFRYFNDECIDVLDFLVLLTCNDTLIFDPFDFAIPGTTFNTRTRIFGPAQGLFGPIRAADFASGRFLIFATAAGTSYESTSGDANADTHMDDYAELRFPHEFMEFIDANDHCPNLQDDTYFGLRSGLQPDNLHVFNSSAVAFNYLIGSWTTSEPETAAGVVSHGTEAFIRPAVDLTEDEVDSSSLRMAPDGDGPALLAANDFRILTGTEVVLASDQTDVVPTNALYLAQRAHGGDTQRVADFTGDADTDFDSWYGALGTTSLYGGGPANAADQAINFFSIIDDYNGSRHSTDAPIANFQDRSYNLNGARTVYVLQIYDNDEFLFDVEEDTPINISPPPFEAPTAILKITVDCLRTWITDNPVPSTSVDDLQISDLFDIAAGLDAFLKFTPGTTPTAEDNREDASHGWIRFVRDNSLGTSNGGDPLHGTWVDGNFIHDMTGRASFVTAAYQIVEIAGRGACWWLFTAASNPLVSETGDPQCDGLCPNPTR